MFIFPVTRTIKKKALVRILVFLFFCSSSRSQPSRSCASSSETSPQNYSTHVSETLHPFIPPSDFCLPDLSIARSRWSRRSKIFPGRREPQNTRHHRDDCPSCRVWRARGGNTAPAPDTFYQVERRDLDANRDTGDDLLHFCFTLYRYMHCMAHSNQRHH